MLDDLDHRATTLASVFPRFRDSPRRPLPGLELLLLVGCQGKSRAEGRRPPPSQSGPSCPSPGRTASAPEEGSGLISSLQGSIRDHLPGLLLQNLTDPARLRTRSVPGSASLLDLPQKWVVLPAGCVRSRPRAGSDLQKFIARMRGRKPAALSTERGREEGWVASWSARAAQTKCHRPGLNSRSLLPVLEATSPRSACWQSGFLLSACSLARR